MLIRIIAVVVAVSVIYRHGRVGASVLGETIRIAFKTLDDAVRLIERMRSFAETAVIRFLRWQLLLWRRVADGAETCLVRAVHIFLFVHHAAEPTQPLVIVKALPNVCCRT